MALFSASFLALLFLYMPLAKSERIAGFSALNVIYNADYGRNSHG